MKTGPGGPAPPNMLTSGGAMSGGGSPPPQGGSPMMPPHSHTPTSQGQMSPGSAGGVHQTQPPSHSPLGPGSGGHLNVPPSHHGGPPSSHQHSVYGIPQTTPSPAGDMSPHQGAHHMSSGSPPVSQWHNVQHQDIKPPPIMGGPGGMGLGSNPHAVHGNPQMFPQYSWYQTADNNMNQGLLT